MSENGEVYTAGKNFTLPPALTALTNSTSDYRSTFFQDLHIVKEFGGVSKICDSTADERRKNSYCMSCIE